MSMNAIHRLKHRIGFTLVELLVVMAIIAMLMTLLFPTLQTGKEHGRGVRCKQNLRQLWTAFQSYAQDHNGQIAHMWFYVRATGGLTKSYGTNAVLSITAGLIYPYIQSIGPYGCPSTTIEGGIRTYEMPWFLGQRNATTSWQGITDESGNSTFRIADTFSMIRRPGQTMMLICCNNDDNVFASHELGARYHFGKNNIIYVDGHVELCGDLATEHAKEAFFHLPDPSRKFADTKK